MGRGGPKPRSGRHTEICIYEWCREPLRSPDSRFLRTGSSSCNHVAFILPVLYLCTITHAASSKISRATQTIRKLAAHPIPSSVIDSIHANRASQHNSQNLNPPSFNTAAVYSSPNTASKHANVTYDQIQSAISDGNRCGKDFLSSSVKAAIVYFSRGIFFPSRGINMLR